VGIADRSCYDLSAHSIATNSQLSAFVEFPDGPRVIEIITPKLNKSKIGAAFKAKGQALIKHLEDLNTTDALNLEKSLKNGPAKIHIGSESYEVTPDMVEQFKHDTKKVAGVQIVPAVIEPSFGIGRILYSILEHAYYAREDDEQRSVLALAPIIAPVKVSVLPLISNPQLLEFIPVISNLLNDLGISYKVDDVGQTVGKRYARTDEIGVPFGITIDFETVNDQTVTLRERDSTKQVRVKISEVALLIKHLVEGKVTWEQTWDKYPHVEKKEE